MSNLFLSTADAQDLSEAVSQTSSGELHHRICNVASGADTRPFFALVVF